MDTVYIETSIVSHATARPSPDPAIAVLQDQAKRWNLRDAQARLEASGRPIARRKQRTIRRSPAGKSGEFALENRSSPSGDC